MGMRRSLILLSTICLVLASETAGSVKKGDLEIEVLGGWAMESGTSLGDDHASIVAGETGADLDGWFASGGIAYFTSKNFQIGLAGFGSSLDGSERTTIYPVSDPIFGSSIVYDVDVDATIYGGGGRFKWHFAPRKALVPYVGVQVLWATADLDVSGTAEHFITVDDITESESVENINESDSDSGVLWGPIVGLRYQLAAQIEILLEYQYHMWSGSIGDILDNGHAISAGLCVKLK